MVVDYRTRVLKISEEDELDTKLTRIPSAKKYKGKRPCLSCAALPLPRTTRGILEFWEDRGSVGLPAVSHDFCPWTCPFLPSDIIRQPSEEEIIKLAPPPKKAWARRRKRRKVGPSSDYSFPILQGRGKGSPPPSTHLLTRS